MRLGAWNVRILYRTGSLTTAVTELTMYKQDLMGVQEVSWNKRGTVTGRGNILFHVKANENYWFGTGYLYTTEYYQQLRE
jgi:hypothetical protein